MKKDITIKNILLLIASVFLFTACSDELNTYPITDIVAPTQYTGLKDAADAEKALNSIHSIFGDEYWQFDYFFLGFLSSFVWVMPWVILIFRTYKGAKIGSE